MTQKEELQELATSLGIDIEGLTIAQLKEVIEPKKAAAEESADEESAAEKAAAEKAADEEAAAEKAAAEKAATENRQVFKDNRGRKYRFKKNAPKTINIDGAFLTPDEILGNEEIMLELIYGNNSFIEPIN